MLQGKQAGVWVIMCQNSQVIMPCNSHVIGTLLTHSNPMTITLALQVHHAIFHLVYPKPGGAQLKFLANDAKADLMALVG